MVDGYADGVTLYDLHAQLCPSGFTAEVDGVELYDDGLHFTSGGAALVWRSLAPVIDDVAGASSEPASPSASASAG